MLYMVSESYEKNQLSECAVSRRMKKIIEKACSFEPDKDVYKRQPKDQYDLPDYAGIMDQYEKLHKDMQDGKVVSAYALDRHGRCV